MKQTVSDLLVLTITIILKYMLAHFVWWTHITASPSITEGAMNIISAKFEAL